MLTINPTVEAKTVELRDNMTMMPVVILRHSRNDWQTNGVRLWRAVGYNDDDIILMPLAHLERTAGQPEVGGRTLREFHLWVYNHWDEVVDGGVVDVRVILGERDEPVESDFD